MLRSLFFLACGLVGFGLAQPVVGAELTARDVTLLTNNCLQCHARSDSGAPQMGDEAAWRDRAKKGEDALLLAVIYGVRAMPPLGNCGACSEQDFRAIIRYLANLPDPVPGQAR